MTDRTPYKLRQDLVVRRRVFGGEVKYVVKDPIKLEYCTVDEMSWMLLSFCDGKRDLGQLTELTQSMFPSVGFDAISLLGFYESYRSFHFFEDQWERNIMLMERRRTDRSRALKKALANPLEITLPAYDPNEFFGRAVVPLRFLWTKGAMVVYVLLFVAAMFVSLTHANEFALTGGSLLFIPGQALLGLVVLWFVLLFTVVLHEFGHGMTCKHFGGAVHRLGFLFLYFNPCLYCDVTEAYFFEDKKYKHYVTLAGGIVDLMTAAIATFIWYFTSPELFLNQVAHRVAIFNGVTGILVNFNPLMKYDGYYLLSDELEIPNLRGDAFHYLGNRIRGLFGLPHEEELITPREKKVFLIYGLLALAYSIFVLLFIFLFVSGMLVGKFRATGIVLSALLLLTMTRRYWMGLWHFLRFFGLDKAAHFRRHRAPYLSAVVIVLAAFFALPIPRHVHGDFVLEPCEEFAVRAPEPGRIDEVLVQEGSRVEAGEILFELREDRIDQARSRATAERREAQIRRAAASAQGEASLATAEEALARASAAEEHFQEARARRLQVSAPFAGVAMSRHPEERLGLWCSAGDTLCVLGDLSSLRAEILVDEGLLGMLQSDREVQLRLSSDPGLLLRGEVELISPEPTGESGEGSHENTGRRRMYRVRVRVENSDGHLIPGLHGRARLAAGSVPAAVHLADRLVRSLRIEFWI